MLRKIFVIMMAVLQAPTAYAQDKELLIIGTMHEVPSIVSRSYKPLLKYARNYMPEAIYTEDIRPNDTLSLKNFTPKFLSIADSLSRTETIDEERFQEL